MNIASGCDFLGGLVETSVEMPPDGLNGECVVHYEGENSKYKMKVMLVNGKREGKAVIMNNGIPYMILEYKNGVLTGNVEVLSQEERVEVIEELVSADLYDNEDGIRDFLVSLAKQNDSLVVYGIDTGEEYGVILSNEKCYAMKWSEKEKEVIEADLKCYEMKYWKDNHWLMIRHENQCKDLDVSGRRWEGSVKDGKPFGFGVLFDEEGKKEYEGFMMDGLKVCYGKEYYSDLDRIKYDGCYYDDMRFGKGILYDRNGIVEYDGLWKNDEPRPVKFNGRTIDNHTEVIEIPNKSFNEVESIILPPFLHSLKRIVIGDECFCHVRLFELDGLSELESVVIGMWSFRIGGERSDGSCRIVNCAKLKSIQIGFESFEDYQSSEMSNLPSLQSIEIGEYCFNYTRSFSLTGLID